MTVGTAAITEVPKPTPDRSRPSRRSRIVVLLIAGALAVGVRVPLMGYESGDYQDFLLPWYRFIEDHGRVWALRYQFSNYNAPYLYFLVALTYLPIPPLVGIKLISVVFDFVVGFFAYRIVDLKYPGSWRPVAAAIVVVSLPTVVLNGSMWGQADAIFAAFGLGGIYFLMRQRPWLSCVFFGLAVSFKLQAVFLLPVLLLAVLRGRVPWRALGLLPAVYVVTDLPAVLLGADPGELAVVYLDQAGTYDRLTLNAPNVFQFIGISESSVLEAAGVAWTGLLVCGLLIAAVLSHIDLTPTRILLAATTFALLVPYLLPAMHERYFYPAETLAVVAAFWLPRHLWSLPVLTQSASVFAYLPYLVGSRNEGGWPFVNFQILAAVMLAALGVSLRITVSHASGGGRLRVSRLRAEERGRPPR
jgi:Gpi18-like mannosyltransferase